MICLLLSFVAQDTFGAPNIPSQHRNCACCQNHCPCKVAVSPAVHQVFISLSAGYLLPKDLYVNPITPTKTPLYSYRHIRNVFHPPNLA